MPTAPFFTLGSTPRGTQFDYVGIVKTMHLNVLLFNAAAPWVDVIFAKEHPESMVDNYSKIPLLVSVTTSSSSVA